MSKTGEIELPQLTAREKMRMVELERRIVQDFGAFFRVGQALAEINDSKLYRASHKTFEAYCKDLWDMARGTAHRYIAAAEVMENVSKLETNEGAGLLPVNEAQARPLTRLKPDKQAEVWRSVVNTVGHEGKITASLVEKAVKGYLGDKITTTVRQAQEKVRQTSSAEFAEVFKKFSEQILEERKSNYKYTSRGFIINTLDQLRADLAEDGDLIDEPAFQGGSDDANKLKRAGFSLFRADRTSLTIKHSGPRGWEKYSGGYKTIKEMEDAFKTLLQDDMHLRG
ncbi:hypothetical protein KKC83_06855 [Patescibacteria group bacterium]|nr:hypothetical protein [Desulfocapsa sp.]MBU3983270.1 hypothetical protein [Pseudomonadota bacterium]MBU4027233.1 hypothetical protein [Patescibacteria group bacterium]MCG2743207.1 hypothetical protein [Desulfobacteraceae bacterium]MBU4396213.1 hypothetical protein [Pseudomonadota bacterium]